MRSITLLLAAATAFVAPAVNAQVGTIYLCHSTGPSISPSANPADAYQQLKITVTSGYDGTPNAFVASRIEALVQGNTINVTMTGFIFGSAPPHPDTCGSVVVGPLPHGHYVANLLLNTQAPLPPTLVASTGFDVTAPIPAVSLWLLIVLGIAIVSFAMPAGRAQTKRNDART